MTNYTIYNTIRFIFKTRNKIMLKNKKAFTLAEVLITLTIIGVIAALTIPNLMKNYQNHANYVALKKSYSVLQNAVKLAERENGTAEDWGMLSTQTWDVAAKIGAKKIEPFLKYSKKCEAPNKDCWVNEIKNLNGSTRQNTDLTTLNGRTNIYTLQDGSVVCVNSCTKTSCADGSALNAQRNDLRYLTFIVDVNGKKGPNQLGRDIFRFSLLDGNRGLVPAGLDASEAQMNANCSKSTTDNNYGGNFCAYKVLKEGGIYY